MTSCLCSVPLLAEAASHKPALYFVRRRVLRVVATGTDRPPADADVCLAMVHTVIRLSRREARLHYRRYGLLLVDETHIIGACTFSTAVRFINPPFVVGLSATPRRNDGLHAQVEWLTGPVLYCIDNLSKDVDVQPVRYKDVRFSYALQSCRWDKNRDGKVDSTATITKLVEDPARTALLTALAREAVDEGRHTLVLSERVQLLVAMEQQLGPDLCGRIQAGKTAKTLAANELAKTKRVVLASFKMAFVGLDIPQLDTLVLASPLKAKEDFKQPIGRIQRGGTDCYPQGGTPKYSRVRIVHSLTHITQMRHYVLTKKKQKQTHTPHCPPTRIVTKCHECQLLTAQVLTAQVRTA